MGRGGRKEPRDGPERRCIVRGESGPTGPLIRFVVGPDDAIVPDLAEKLPGRGLWVTADRDVLTRAVAKGHFARAARQKVAVPAELAQLVETGLTRQVTDLVSLARKAGQAVAGYEKARGWLLSGEAAALIQASDGSARGKTKLRMAPEDGAYIDCLTARELGLSFGRDHVIHAALRAGGLTTRIVRDAGRLSGLRGTNGASGLGKDERTA